MKITKEFWLNQWKLMMCNKNTNCYLLIHGLFVCADCIYGLPFEDATRRMEEKNERLQRS